MTPDVLPIVAWGQYLHWAELQFRTYLVCDEGTCTSEVLGTAAHWLAAEYVVLEGWREMGAADKAIDAILLAYPEHSDILRRCRNAVYHFQKEILDKRIMSCITDHNEELSVAAALHFEFQRYLFQYPYQFAGSEDDIVGLRADIAGCIGWFPDDSVFARAWRVRDKCLYLLRMTEGESNEHAVVVRAEAAASLARILKMDATPMTSRLKRIKR